MSRIGKVPVDVPAGVKVALNGRKLSVEGPKGKLSLDLPRLTTAEVDEKQVKVARDNDTKEARAMHGLGRSLIFNMVKGVSDGFVKDLQIEGVGFKAAVQGKEIALNLGYSHVIHYALPDEVKVTVAENTKIKIEGANKQKVGQVAAEIRNFYPPEPYKGKGVRYADEKVVRKEGKTVQ